jgi:hypothetical protein
MTHRIRKDEEHMTHHKKFVPSWPKLVHSRKIFLSIKFIHIFNLLKNHIMYLICGISIVLSIPIYM